MFTFSPIPVSIEIASLAKLQDPRRVRPTSGVYIDFANYAGAYPSGSSLT